MEKKKIDFVKYSEMHDEEVINGADGVQVTVRNHIPYTEKYRMAQEMVEQNVIIHNDSCAYDSYRDSAVWKLKVLEYYTDVDTETVTPEEASDFLINNRLADQLMEIVGDDLGEVEEIYFTMRDGVIQTYEDDHSLKHALKTSFGFLFNGEDLSESLAKAETAGGTLFEALAALHNEEKKKNPGRIDVGGTILSFAKKE